MPVVNGSEALVGFLVKHILDAVAGVVRSPSDKSRRVGYGLREGVRQQRSEPVTRSSFHTQLPGIVSRKSAAGGLKYIVEQVERIVFPDVDGEGNQPPEARPQAGIFDRVGIKRPSGLRIDRLGGNVPQLHRRERTVRFRRIRIFPTVQPGAFAANIGQLYEYVGRKLTLNAEVPVLDISVLEIGRDVIGPRRKLAWTGIL